MKLDNKNKIYKVFNQEMFDLIFNKIELNMRELGYGDVTINKNMKFLVKTFYNILLNSEKYKEMSDDAKSRFLNKYLNTNNSKNNTNYMAIIDYFNKYEAFCFDLIPYNVLQGEIKFN